MESCLFCKIAAGTIPATVVYSDDEIVAFRDINPAAPVHILLIPRLHFADAAEFAEKAPELLASLVQRATATAAAEGLAANGYRLVFNSGAHGGQTVYHVHLHLLGGRPMGWPPG